VSSHFSKILYNCILPQLTNAAIVALTIALKLLGFNNAYHGRDALTFNPRDCELWWKALRAKYDGKGKEFGRKEFDQLLGHCQVNKTICGAEMALLEKR
jgi:hypothetical protein